MRIALVRGPFLNPWELQTYLPLAERHSITAIGGDYQLYREPFANGSISIQRVPVWGASFAKIHPRLFTAFNRGLSWTMGKSYGLCRLEEAVGNPDVIHSAEIYSTLTHQCLELSRKRPCKVVATIWENLPHMGELHPLRRKRKQRALRELDGFLVATETSRQMLLEEGAPSERIEVIPMGVDVTRFKPAPRDPRWAARWNIKPTEKIVLFVGRWVVEKGIQELLQAIPKVLKSFLSPVRFCFVGAGPLKAELDKASKEYPGQVLMMPFPTYEDESVLHNMADIFVLPSKPKPKWQEQFGMVLVESMACGKAIVTTQSGSILDVVGDAALLVPPADSDALATALIRLLTSDKERLEIGEKARARAVEQFDAQKNARRIEAFYERVLKQPS